MPCPAPSATARPARQGRAWLPALLALILSLAACGWLTRQVVASDWIMDADEAVHAVEALRRFDRLEHGRLGQFLVDCYLPERWQPPVQDHVRWYGIVHSLSLLPSFALLGPGDVAARLPSVLYLLGTCAVLYALARRLAPRHGAWAGLVAVALLLSAPNVITFTPQALTEACVLFWCHLGLYAYVRFVEDPASLRRALLTGGALAAAVLSKYDHGLLLVACLGVAELVRVRGRPLAILRAPALAVFAVPFLALALWLVHPDKWQAFRDTLAHPAYGTWRVIAANAAASWVYEYTSSLGALVLLAAGFLLALRRLDDPRVRGVWIYAVLSTLLLVARARFQFRYNLVEVPAFFVLAGALVPDALQRAAARATLTPAVRLRRRALVAALAGALLLACAFLVLRRPEALRGPLEGALGRVLGDGPGRLGLSRSPQEYADSLMVVLQRSLALAEVSVLSLGAALLGLAAWQATASLGPTLPARHLRAFVLTVALATLPGAAAFWDRAEGMVRWEWEGAPQLGEVIAEVGQRTPVPGRLLLGGGWDQLTNNTLRWYLLTRELEPRPAYDEVQVVGDMIGSLVLPEPPRIDWWARVLREGQGDQLPERVVLLDWREDFLYQEAVGPEVEVYREILAQRPAYERLAAEGFDELGLELEVWALRHDGLPALSDPRGAAAADLLGPTGRWTPGRWSISDYAWRHLDCPWAR
jgi:4-amino-4-deoxy-L-arabinose transferase-like glycosyltransferase